MHAYKQDIAELLEDMDHCLMGYMGNGLDVDGEPVYSYEKVIEWFMQDTGGSRELAVEFIEVSLPGVWVIETKTEREEQ